MRYYADPSRCPDCDSSLQPGSAHCPVCRLDLSGALGRELFATLLRADTLLTQMRQQSAPAPAPAAALAEDERAAYQPQPPSPVVRPSSVPKVLLGLGAVCLLVAALVFLAVTWSRLGVGGRTAILVGLTLGSGALTAWLARRDLRAAVEALGLVTLGLTVLDLYGAESAGWLGEPSEAGMATIVGTVLVGAGLGSVRLLSRTPAGGFGTGELAVALGALLVSVGLASQGWGAVAARQLLALCLVLALTAVTWRLAGRVQAGPKVTRAFQVAAWALVPVVVLDWVALVVVGLDDLGPQPSMASAWVGLDAWPLLAAGVVALLVAVPGGLPTVARVGGAALGLVPVGLAVVAPAGDESTTVAVLAVLAVTAALVALMVLAPPPWGGTALAAGALCALALWATVLQLAADAVERYAAAASAGWAGTTEGLLPVLDRPGAAAPWLLPLCAATLLALLWSAARLTRAGRRIGRRAALDVAGVVLGTSVVAMLLLYAVPVWSVLVALVAATVVLAQQSLARGSVPAAVLGATTLSAAVALSWYDDQLTAATVTVALVLSAAMHLRTRAEVVATLAGAAVAGLLAGLIWTVGAIADAPPGWVGLVGLLLLAGLLLGRPWVPLGMRTPGTAAVLELAVACAASVLASTTITRIPEVDQSTWGAVHLTVAGAAAIALALTRPDRRRTAWVGGALLAAATWLRLSDLGVDEPEPYTLPSALALLTVGLLRLRSDRSAGTSETLGAGLALALVPSLLWVVADPGGVRSVLLGLACLVLVVGGAQLRWVAPFVQGAVVGLVVVLVEAGPQVGAAVPRWALIGAAGAVLVALGATWEQRLRDARSVAAYVRGLR